jgi:2-succinyl-5-enolpyruvyl-6-hydroxy-3-cyclohexene-1-carboxylate synthase
LIASDDFEEWWGAPHNVKLEALVEAFRGKYKALEVDENMHEALFQLLAEPGFAVLEIKTDRSENLAMHRQYWREATDIVSVIEKE